MYWCKKGEPSMYRFQLVCCIILMFIGISIFAKPQSDQGIEASQNGDTNRVQVIVSAAGETNVLTDTVESYGGEAIETLPIIAAMVASVPHHQIGALQEDARVERVVLDAPVHNRSDLTVKPVSLVSAENPHETYANNVFLPIVIGGSAIETRSQNPETDLNQLEEVITNEHTMLVYGDELHTDWQVDGTAVVDLSATKVLTDETGFSMSAEFANGWDSLTLQHASGVTLEEYDTLSFWLNGGELGGQQLWLKAISADGEWGTSSTIIVAEADNWLYYELPLTDLTDADEIIGLQWFSLSDAEQATFYLDNVRLVNQSRAESEERGAWDQLGLTYNYYHGTWSWLPDFSSLTPRYSGINDKFDLDIADRSTDFAIVQRGYIYLPQDGTYTFYTESNDGSKLYIDGQQIVDNNGNHTMRERSGSVWLNEGFHHIKVTFYQGANTSGLKVSYQGPTISKQEIPGTVLYVNNPSADPGRGTILREWWNGVSGWDVTHLTDHSNYPKYPSGSDYRTEFEAPSNWSDPFGSKMSGYLYPPTTGWYRFWIASDDYSELHLSPTSNSAHKQQIAYIDGYTALHEWTKFSSQVSDWQYLEAGERYYIEALYKDHGGGDNLSVAWQVPGGSREVIDGDFLSPVLTRKAQLSDPLGYIDGLGLDVLSETGDDIQIGVMDTGLDFDSLSYAPGRPWAWCTGTTGYGNITANTSSTDENGHGTFMAGIMASRRNHRGRSIGVAPESIPFGFSILDEEGKATISTVVSGLNCIKYLNDQDILDFRVVNLSLQGPVLGPYWTDAMSQAVERLWDDGIVVVVAAGNTGPHAGSITSPGNNPHVITVGAYTDNYTPDDPSDDFVPPFSAAGPTEVGFIKPDIVAPGAHLAVALESTTRHAQNPYTIQTNDGLYTGSGTSGAAAFTSGVVALMLERHPNLTPDQVKYRLMASADPLLSGAILVSDFDTVVDRRGQLSRNNSRMTHAGPYYWNWTTEETEWNYWDVYHNGDGNNGYVDYDIVLDAPQDWSQLDTLEIDATAWCTDCNNKRKYQVRLYDNNGWHTVDTVDMDQDGQKVRLSFANMSNRDQISKVRIRVYANYFSNLTTANARFRMHLNHIIALDSSRQGYDGELSTFSIFQQGMGRIDPVEAVLGSYTGEANGSMEPGNAYYGPVVYDATRDGYMLVDENRNPLPEGEDYFWDGGWIFSGNWIFSNSYAYSGGWIFSGNWIFSSNWIFSGGWIFSGNWIFSSDYFTHSNYYWNSTHYWAGTHYWNGTHYWTGMVPSDY